MKTFGVVAALIAAMAFFVLLFSPPTPPSTVAKRAERTTPERAQDKMSGQLFSELTPGVTTLSVMSEYLDTEGELVSSSYVAGISTKSYVLRNSDGSTVSLMFQNGVLAAKRQSGLQ